jgi:DNA-binding XRE family transcriptional regulator
MTATRKQLPTRNLIELRLRAELSRKQLATLADVTTRTIEKIEGGRVPHVPTQIKIAAALNRALGVDSPTYPHRLTHLDLWPLEDDAEAVA